MNRKMYLLLLATAVGTTACEEKTPKAGSESNTETASKTSTQAPVEADASPSQPKTNVDQIYSTRCAMCHGQQGAGDGAAAQPLTVKPRNFQDQEWQDSVSDEEIKEIIVKGGAATGKDPGMPAGPDLAKDERLLDALVKKVRSFSG